MCTLIHKEIINNGSDGYSYLLDASKAFDRVHFKINYREIFMKYVCIIRY